MQTHSREDSYVSKKILMYVINLALLFFKRNYIMFKKSQNCITQKFSPIFFKKFDFPFLNEDICFVYKKWNRHD